LRKEKKKRGGSHGHIRNKSNAKENRGAKKRKKEKALKDHKDPNTNKKKYRAETTGRLATVFGLQ